MKLVLREYNSMKLNIIPAIYCKAKSPLTLRVLARLRAVREERFLTQSTESVTIDVLAKFNDRSCDKPSMPDNPVTW